jgi:hypothetical protein
LTTAEFSETIHCGTPKEGKNFSNKQLTTSSEDTFLYGYMGTDLENPSSNTRIALFPLRLGKSGPPQSMNMFSEGFARTSL